MITSTAPPFSTNLDIGTLPLPIFSGGILSESNFFTVARLSNINWGAPLQDLTYPLDISMTSPSFKPKSSQEVYLTFPVSSPRIPEYTTFSSPRAETSLSCKERILATTPTFPISAIRFPILDLTGSLFTKDISDGSAFSISVLSERFICGSPLHSLAYAFFIFITSPFSNPKSFQAVNDRTAVSSPKKP